MLYIDFDGVILDTGPLLFYEWEQIPNHRFLPEAEKVKYIERADWKSILKESLVVNDSINILKQMDPTKSFILTKIHSYENEGLAKIEWARENDIKQQVILVPYGSRKCDIVDARGNILVDDSLFNLDEWEASGGSGVFFDIDDDNIDSWQQPNTKGYQRVLSLESFLNKNN